MPRLAENKVIEDLEHIVHTAKHPKDEVHLVKLDIAYQKKLGVLARFNHPETFTRYLNLYHRYFQGATYVN